MDANGAYVLSFQNGVLVKVSVDVSLGMMTVSMVMPPALKVISGNCLVLVPV